MLIHVRGPYLLENTLYPILIHWGPHPRGGVAHLYTTTKLSINSVYTTTVITSYRLQNYNIILLRVNFNE